MHEAITDLNKKKSHHEVGEEHADVVSVVPANVNEILEMGANIFMEYAGNEVEWEARSRHSRFQQAYSRLESAKDPASFAQALDQEWLGIRGCALHAYGDIEKLIARNRLEWLELRDQAPKNQCELMQEGKKKLVISAEALRTASDQDFIVAKQSLLQIFDRQFAFSKGRDDKFATKRAIMAEEEKWIAVYDILKSETVQAAKLSDLKECERKLKAIAKIDYLPEDARVS